uniref:NTF2-related export protein n=1 Tax=Neobodo designis TaxID=312471 RepID=A0A7S1Q6U0_NEODS|eukprot:CAMPEP_0174850194 /NCGR_PEP_ID=MMETSP1114-20130205/19091_1 /TAXON_ID=312471 /ORGANISM="Neobodo designis, Strain CCAP 1951/1" /LENGTH=141 /DNA_ID=CAMNT_0016084631 /DNA_START=26 /DNA_END=451 /DNA_ORIENTATION=+
MSTLDNGVLNELTSAARRFKDAYYQALDASPERRQELLTRYYPAQVQHPVMTWNGHVLATPADVGQYMANLPKTKHTIYSADVQPLPGAERIETFFITITGTCIFDDEHPRNFYQRLTVCHQEGRLYIVQDYYRWTAEKTN